MTGGHVSNGRDVLVLSGTRTPIGSGCLARAPDRRDRRDPGNQALYELRRVDGRHALVTICIGGGQGIAAFFERACAARLGQTMTDQKQEAAHECAGSGTADRGRRE
jgi:hypothetical protein